MAEHIDLQRLEDFDRDVIEMAIADRAEIVSTDQTRERIAYFLEGESFRQPEPVMLILRDLARRVRAGDY